MIWSPAILPRHHLTRLPKFPRTVSHPFKGRPHKRTATVFKIFKLKKLPYFIDPLQHLQRMMSSNYQTMIRAHLPVIIDYLGLGTSSLYSFAIAWQLGWLNVLCSHRYCTHRLLKSNFRRWPCIPHLCSGLRFTCPRTLSRPYPSSNSHPLWRSSHHWNRFDRFLCPGFNTHWSPLICRRR